MRVSQTQVTGVAASPWLPLDFLTSGDSYGCGMFVKPGAGATVQVQATADDIFDPAVTPVAFNVGSALTANTASALGFAARAVRLNQTVGASTSTLQVVNPGLR